MKLSTLLPIAITTATGANALFDCNSNQHAFPPTTGRFVVHYTSIRDTEIDGEPWIRICKPSGNGWSQVAPLTMDCASDKYTFGTGDTGLRDSFTVVNGNGCNSDSSNLSGAEMSYRGQKRSLSGSDSGCGKRDHGISCEFDL
ncbi:hypothetical protein ASPVEDRAFT_77659 [Aspergillus versicolor CBS 583.65]|uniref:Cyanovirin-N domain-containing protein n=1 Tax=Aspergillus versicolor CBS 583.65 TaxID=1036611 RepID=A0A1L9P2Y6_ASPVE|nr:uncharacterized protein ASPVEDRAFT_77659 [Aspergillus versicolor CBS 583.65]OJI95885.1 hypothetical protein ASPVEDRAFT_77659 [Aspergillus versicolor CBS 583.65]